MSTGPSKANQSVDVLSRCVGTIVKILATVLIASVVAIVIEWLGTGRLWDEHDGSRLQLRTAAEMQMLKSRFSGREGPVSIFRVYSIYTHCVDRALLPLERKISQRSEELQKDGDQLQGLLRSIGSVFGALVPHIQIAFEVVRACTFRLAVLTCALVPISLLLFVGVVDGLVRRDIRRWSGGRESSLGFNLASQLIAPLTIGSILTLMIWPWTLNAAWCTATIGSILAIAVSIAVSRFKKYV